MLFILIKWSANALAATTEAPTIIITKHQHQITEMQWKNWEERRRRAHKRANHIKIIPNAHLNVRMWVIAESKCILRFFGFGSVCTKFECVCAHDAVASFFLSLWLLSFVSVRVRVCVCVRIFLLCFILFCTIQLNCGTHFHSKQQNIVEIEPFCGRYP